MIISLVIMHNFKKREFIKKYNDILHFPQIKALQGHAVSKWQYLNFLITQF